MSETRKAETVWDRAVDAFERGKDELTKISRVGKMKLDLTRLQKERTQLFRKLGEETYKLFKEDRFQRQEVDKFLSRIDQINEQIETVRTEIQSTAKTIGATKKSTDL